MFPRDSDRFSFFPELNWSKLLEYVMLPEVVHILVSQDLGVVGEEQVRTVMFTSAKFGRTCHQDDDGYLVDDYMRG